MYEQDENGNLVPVYTTGVNRRVYDRSKPEMRQWWVDVAVSMASESVIDGVFSDNMGAALLPAYDSNGEPGSDHFNMMDALANHCHKASSTLETASGKFIPMAAGVTPARRWFLHGQYW